MESPLKPEGLFILFGMCSMVAVGFEWYFVAETQGLSEREKKNLYIPGQPYGRKLKEGEELPEQLRCSKTSEFSVSLRSSRASRSSMRFMYSDYGIDDES